MLDEKAIAELRGKLTAYVADPGITAGIPVIEAFNRVGGEHALTLHLLDWYSFGLKAKAFLEEHGARVATVILGTCPAAIWMHFCSVLESARALSPEASKADKLDEALREAAGVREQLGEWTAREAAWDKLVWEEKSRAESAEKRLAEALSELDRHKRGAEEMFKERREIMAALGLAAGSIKAPAEHAADLYQAQRSAEKRVAEAEVLLDTVRLELANGKVITAGVMLDNWRAKDARPWLRDAAPPPPRAEPPKSAFRVGDSVRVRPNASGATWWEGRDSIVTKVLSDTDIRIRDAAGVSEQSGPWAAHELERWQPKSAETKACPECSGAGQHPNAYPGAGCWMCGKGNGRIPTSGAAKGSNG